MNNTNPYAPPKAEVGDHTSLEAAPTLWNPNAAASWSLLFSPIFGSILHMKNWEAMGQLEKAQSSKNWAIGSSVFFLFSILIAAVLPESRTVDGLSRLAALALLLSWYYSIGKSQNAYVVAKYGKNYPRKAWSKPLLIALALFVGVIVGAGIVGFVAGAVAGAA